MEDEDAMQEAFFEMRWLDAIPHKGGMLLLPGFFEQLCERDRKQAEKIVELQKHISELEKSLSANQAYTDLLDTRLCHLEDRVAGMAYIHT